MAVTEFSRLVRRTVLTESGCLEWTGSNNGHGYGEVRIGGKKRYAHRLAYEAKVGPIADGMVIDHLCRNRACINPLHLEATTHTLNIRRGLRGGSIAEDGSFQCKSCGSDDFYVVKSPRSHGGQTKQCAPCSRKSYASYVARNRESVNARRRAAWAAKKAAK